MMIALYFLILSFVLIDSMLVVHFGSNEALLSEVRSIIEKKKSLWLVVKNVILYSSFRNLVWLFIGFFAGIGSLIGILFEILHVNDSPIAKILLIAGLGSLFFSIGLISIMKQEFHGRPCLEGIPAVIMGWIFVLV